MSKVPQLSEPALTPFLADNFDPAAYLNSTLPSLQTSHKSGKDAVSLADLTSRTQSLLATLNTHSNRLASTLTQMTDDVIRSGSRLAYQVDLLRGDALSLNESLSEKLSDQIAVFVPGNTPPAISRLQMFLTVRERLDTVIKLFGAALAWPPPPSSSGTSFISVSSTPSRDADVKAMAWLDVQKSELLSIIENGKEAEARAKLKELGELSQLWMNSAEEKARKLVVTDLEKFVDNQTRSQEAVEDERQSAFLTGIYT